MIKTERLYGYVLLCMPKSSMIRCSLLC
ncbi:hypothetical protein VEx25_1646, partial [Vibrio antiquarius]